ncbi:MAG: hypothetical protein RL141_915 [Candidatus Parcubacteria bacterium]|jgi:biotin carboxylase
MKRILMIGAGWEQTPLIQKATSLGHWVLATNPSLTGEALAYADEARAVDPRDIMALDRLVQEHRIEAIITDNCDYSLYASGLLCEKHGFPGPSFTAVSHSNNKRKSRITCAAAGIRQPAFQVCETFADAQKGVDAVGGYPVILKPVDNRGNFGVNIATTPEELSSAYFEAVANAHSRQTVLEKFIEGTLITVEGFAMRHPAQHVSYAVSSKKMLGGKKGVALELNYPANLPEVIQQKAMDINDQVVKALGYDFGFTHTEYIVDAHGEIWLVESTNRGGGVFLSELILPTLTGIDVLERLVNMACGEPVPPLPTRAETPLQGFVTLSFMRLPSGGTIKAIEGVEAMRALPGVLQGRMMVEVGEQINPIINDAKRHGFVLATAPTREALEALIEQAKQTVQVTFV